MDTFFRDLRYSVRMLIKSPAFTVVAVLSIALGIGANTTVFSVINAVLLRALPYKDPQSLVLVWGDTRTESSLRGRNQVSATDVADFRSQATVFEDIAIFTGWNPIMSGDSQAERIPATQVGDGFFKIMKGTPILGRVFTPEEQEDGKDFVIVLGFGLWQRRFGSDSNIVGKTVQLNSRPYTIVGVMGPDFSPLPSSLVLPEGQFYRPVAESFSDPKRDERHLRAIARLKPGVTVEQARSEISVLAQRLEREHPTTNRGRGANVVSLTEDTVGKARRTLWLVFGSVIFVLLVACANVANLLLARATSRYKEITIRAAIGAGRVQLIRQLLTESMLLALLGGGMGLLFAMWGTGIVQTVGAKINPMFRDIRIDTLCLAFTFGVTVITGLFFGIAPALQLSKPNLAESLKEGGRSAGGAAPRNRLRGGLVIAEVAMTLVLLVCAGLLIRTVMRLREVDTGFNPQNVLTMNIGLPSAKYPKTENVVTFYQQTADRIDKDQAVYNVTTLEQLQSESILLRRLFMSLLVVFALIGLVLAAVGIYGVMSYAVTQRTQEIGIRMALGARAADVLKLVVGNGMSLALIGVAMGLIIAFALTRLMETVLFGVTPTDAITFVSVAVGLIAVALFACYIPARRATKVDPLVALRYE